MLTSATSSPSTDPRQRHMDGPANHPAAVAAPPRSPRNVTPPPASNMDRPDAAVRWQPRQPRQGRQGPTDRLSGDGVCWVATHGGAGATTLAAVVGGVDVGCRWPDAARREPARILLLARTHEQGLRAASRALNAIREGRHPVGMELLALVLVADAPGRLPVPLLTRIRLLRSVVPVQRVPWIPQWRLGKTVDRLPGQLVRVGGLIQATQLGAGR